MMLQRKHYVSFSQCIKMPDRWTSIEKTNIDDNYNNEISPYLNKIDVYKNGRGLGNDCIALFIPDPYQKINSIRVPCNKSFYNTDVVCIDAKSIRVKGDYVLKQLNNFVGE